MAERIRRSPVTAVGLVAVAAAALLFLGVWVQAARAERWADMPGGLYPTASMLLDSGKGSCYHTFQA